MGVRQLGHALQGLRPAGRPARPLREDRRRRPGAPLHGLAPTVALHIPWDKVDDFGKLRRHADRPRRRASARSTRTPSRTTTTSSAASATPTRACGARPSTTCSTASTSWTRPARATSRSGSPTAPTTPARTTSGPARTGWPRRWRSSTRASATASGWCSSTSSSSRRSTRPTCPTGARPTPTAPRSASEAGRVPRHRPPRPGHEHRVHRRLSCSGSDKLGAFDFNSRFYADDDLMVGAADPVPAVPDPARGRPRRRLDAEPAWPSCSTSATTSSRRSPARSARCSTCRR